MELAAPVVTSHWPEPLQESCTDSNMAAPKGACLHVMVAFTNPPTVMRLGALLIIFVPTMTGTALE